MALPPAPPLAIPEADRKELVALSRQRSIPRGILLRVNIVLGAERRADHLLARDPFTTVTTVLLGAKTL
jgi:hypothetical protein